MEIGKEILETSIDRTITFIIRDFADLEIIKIIKEDFIIKPDEDGDWSYCVNEAINSGVFVVDSYGKLALTDLGEYLWAVFEELTSKVELELIRRSK